MRKRALNGRDLHSDHVGRSVGGGSGGGLNRDGKGVTIRTMERERSCFRGKGKERRRWSGGDSSERCTLEIGPERIFLGRTLYMFVAVS